jgi:transposase
MQRSTSPLARSVTSAPSATPRRNFSGFFGCSAKHYRNRELHVILDNSSAHGTSAVQRWLEKHPNVHFHYTPTSASWLNQVEALFSILTRQSLRQGDFRTKTALRKHIEVFLERWNQNPTPFIWTRKPHRLIRDHRRMLARISYAAHQLAFAYLYSLALPKTTASRQTAAIPCSKGAASEFGLTP